MAEGAARAQIAGAEPPLEERRIGRVTVLFGAEGGKYPDGNSVLVEGAEETLLIDPALGVIPRHARLPPVDRVLLSHCHEDHLAANHLFTQVPVWLHELDRPGLQSLRDFMAIYGLPPEAEPGFRALVVERFHYLPRPDAQTLGEGDVIDLGGVRIHVLHTPGHTWGHCAFLIEPEGVLYLGDIDLSSFGPYYGDAWSDLESFERTLERVREIEAHHYATFHHIGVLDGRPAFQERLDRFGGVIPARERRLLEFLREPRTLAEIIRHRIVYRPGDPASAMVDAVERRSATQHLARLARDGRVERTEPERYRARAP